MVDSARMQDLNGKRSGDNQSALFETSIAHRRNPTYSLEGAAEKGRSDTVSVSPLHEDPVVDLELRKRVSRLEYS